jgi:predicted nucleotidyltransferase
MASKKLPSLRELARRLERLLKKYDGIYDIIIFGSYVKSKGTPGDIDMALIMKDKDLELYSRFKEDLGCEEAHINIVPAGDLFKSPLLKTFLTEGYSVEQKRFLRDVIGENPMKMFIYSLKGFPSSKKVQFSKALNKSLQTVKGMRTGAGAVLIPISQASYFEDFLDVWGLKYKTKELTVF